MTDEDLSGVHLWLVLHKTAQAVEAHARAHVATLDLCLSDFAVLEVLLHKGPLPVNTVGRRVLLTSGSITTAVDRLARQGFVLRRPDPEDGRISLVELTGEGRAFIEKAFGEHTIAMEEACRPLSPAERRQVLRLLRKWGRGAEALL